MDWQATEFNDAWRYAFMALIRKDAAYHDPHALARSIAQWNRCVVILNAQLEDTQAWVAGDTFTLADIVLGLSVNRWKMTPFEKPEVPAVEKWFAQLNQREAFRLHGNNGVP
jgi:glutathione S-transferase